MRTLRESPWYLVTVLTVAYVFSFIDRSILTLMVGPIRADLGLSDTEISVLHGFAFAIFYTVLGIPIARIADRSNRRNLVVAGVAFWSLATAACGLTRSFAQLFLARIGVGIGEAALSPAAYSMISDRFPPERLGRALGVYTLGAIAGIGLALIIGGAVVGAVATGSGTTLPLIGEVRPWQLVFFVVGLPGLLVAGWLATIAEPARRGRTPRPDSAGAPADLTRWMRTYARAYTGHLVGFALLGIVLNAVIAWTPSHLIRNFGYSPAEVGLTLGGTVLLFGTPGIFCGGILADRWRAAGHGDGALRVGIVSAVGSLPFALIAFVTSSLPVLVVALAPLAFFATFAYGAAPAAIQFMTPAANRAVASAIYLFFLNFVGMGIGPFLTALVTDRVFGNDQAVGLSIAIVATASALGAAAFLAWSLPDHRRAVAAASRA
jgi:MFS family permease